MRDDSSPKTCGNFSGPVGAVGIHHDHFIAARQTGDRFGDSTFLVECNDRRGDLWHPQYAITECNAEPQADTRLRRYRIPRMASTARGSDYSGTTRTILLETV